MRQKQRISREVKSTGDDGEIFNSTTEHLVIKFFLCSSANSYDYDHFFLIKKKSKIMSYTDDY